MTLEGNFIFWTDWTSNSVFVAHKQLALNARVVRDFLRDRPYGIEAVTPTRQANGVRERERERGGERKGRRGEREGGREGQ